MPLLSVKFLITLSNVLLFCHGDPKCKFDSQNQITQPCGNCGVCRKKIGTDALVCDQSFLTNTTHGLFLLNPSTNECELKNYCDDHKCQNQITSKQCITHIGNFHCQCHESFFGQNCEFEIHGIWKYHYAIVQNIIFTPIFFSTEHAEIYIVFYHEGLDLRVLLNNGRGEELQYTNSICKEFKSLKTIENICKNTFNSLQDIKQCVGDPYVMTQYKLKPCLMQITMPYPRENYNDNELIYEYINGNKSNSPVLGKQETVSIDIYTHILMFSQSFTMLNIYDRLGQLNLCVPRIRLLNCARNMNKLVNITQYRDLTILSSILINDLETTCSSLEKLIMKWAVWPITENHDELTDRPALQVFDKNHFNVKENMLAYGVHKVKLFVTAVYSNDVVPATGYCYFKTIRVPIQTRIMGGSHRIIHYTHNIYFRVISCLVPSGKCIKDNKVKIIYTWTCQEKESFCEPYKTTERKRLIYGPFRPSVKYVFVLSVKSIDYNFKIEQIFNEHSETQVIETSSQPTLDLSIICLMNCGGNVFKTNPQEIIHLEATFIGPSSPFKNLTLYSRPFKWFYDNGTKDIQNLIEIGNELKETPTAVNVLVLKSDVLSYNKTYTFFVLSPDFCKIEIQTNEMFSPEDISCLVEPENGVQGETYFSINCIYKKSSLSSVLFEFNNKYEGNSRERHIGFSKSGYLEDFLLIREQLCVHVIDLYGTFYEYILNINLKSSSHNLTYFVSQFTNHLANNYIYRMGKISAYGDLLGEQGFFPNLIDLLLEELLHEEIDSITGAIQLESTLYHVACRGRSLRDIEKLNFMSIYGIAKIIHRVSFLLKDYQKQLSKSSRVLTTKRILEITYSVTECASLVLQVTKRHLFDAVSHKTLLDSVYLTTRAMNDLAVSVAFQLLPSLLHVNIERFQIQITAKLASSANNLVPPNISTVPYYSDSRKLSNYFSILTTYKNNPYWWGNGEQINTDVKYFRIFHKLSLITNLQTKNIVDLDLSVHGFEPMSVYGHVMQPDPKNRPEINDFVVAVHRILPHKGSVTFVKFTDIGNSTELRVAILQEQRPDYNFMESSSSVIKKNKILQFRNSEENKDSFFYMGVLPAVGVNANTFMNYSFELYSANCRVWKYKAWLIGKTCQVGSRTNHTILQCNCQQLPMTIGGYISVPDNDFNPFSDIPLITDLTEYPFITVYMVLNLVFYALVMTWTRKKDKVDKLHVYAILLEDNDPRDTFGYLVGVFTGCRLLAGTSSKVGIRLIGKEGISRPHLLNCNYRQILTINSDDWFLIFTPHHLGPLTKVSLWIDYSGPLPNWYCSKLFVCDLTRFDTDIFIIEKWFGVNLNKIELRTIQEAATYKEINNTRRIISENIQFALREQHLTLSVFVKHPRGLASRTQRWAVTYSSFFVTTAVVAWLYFITTPEAEDFSRLRFSYSCIIIAIVGNLIGTLISIYMINKFKSSYEFISDISGFHNHSDCRSMHHFERRISSEDTESPHWLKVLQTNLVKNFEPWKLIPIQTNEEKLIGVKVIEIKLIYSWILCIFIFILSWNITVMASIKFGPRKSLYWYLSVLASSVVVSFITEPVKVLVTALLMGNTKIRIITLSTHCLNINRILEKFRQNINIEHEFDLYRRRSLDMYYPPPLFRNFELRKNQTRMLIFWKIYHSIFCLLMLTVLTLFIYSFDLSTTFLTNIQICNQIKSLEFCKSFHEKKLESMYEFMGHILSQVMPALYTLKWYNGLNMSTAEEQFPDTGWLEDGSSRLIGPLRLRQFRSLSVACPIPSVLRSLNTFCYSKQLSLDTEDHGQYNTSWKHEGWTEPLFTESPWEFRSPDIFERGSYVKAPSGYMIPSGGYKANLMRTLEKSTHIVQSLTETGWIGHETRIVLLEFTTYNSNSNFFTATSIIAEYNPIGNVMTQYFIGSMRLTSITISGTIINLYFLIVFTRMCLTINVIGIKNYMKDVWCVLEFVMVCVYIFIIFQYMLYVMDMAEWEDKLQKNGKEVFFNIYVLINRYNVLRHSLGLLFWLAALRLLRIVKFNSDVREYIQDLGKAKQDIIWTWAIVVLFIFIQYRIIMFLVGPPPISSLENILAFQSEFGREVSQLKGLNRILAFLLSVTMKVSMFSFILSFTHHYKKRLKQRQKSDTNTLVQIL